jgi:hypothetical protein
MGLELRIQQSPFETRDGGIVTFAKQGKSLPQQMGLLARISAASTGAFANGRSCGDRGS